MRFAAAVVSHAAVLQGLMLTAQATCLGIASVSLLFLLFRGSVFVGRVYSNMKSGKVFAPRRKRILILAFVALVTQCINIIFWVGC